MNIATPERRIPTDTQTMTDSWRIRVVTLGLLAIILPLAARGLYGPPGALVNIRWQPSVDAVERQRLETDWQLVDGQEVSPFTWRYDLTAPSEDRLRAIVAHAAVADTHNIDRQQYTLAPEAPRTARRHGLINAGGDIAVGLADRLALILVALAGLCVVVKHSAISISRAMSSTAAAYRLTPRARTLGAIALVLTPGVCLMFWLAPLQSFLGFGLGGLLLVGSYAATRPRRTVYAAVALALLLVGMVTAPLPLRVTDDNGEWMGDYEDHTSDRANFETVSGYTSIPFPHHLTALVLKALDAALGATATSPARAFRWLSALAGGLFVAELLGIAMLEGWSAGALRYLALCVAAPVTLLFFGYREIGYLALSAAGIPLLLRGFSVVGRRSSVIAAALVMGLRSAFHGFGLLSLAGGALSALASVGSVRDRLARATVFGVWATAAWLGWLGWYLVGLKLPVEPGHAASIDLRPLSTLYVADYGLVDPILSGSGMRDIAATSVVVGVPVLLLGLLSRSGAARERRLALMFALPSLAFLVAWWPIQGVNMEMDLIFATFPAFFAGAWLCARTRRATVAALGLAALAHASFWYVVRSDDFGSHPVPVVRVRWVETLGDAQRTAIEQSLGLSDAEHSAGSTWRYRVSDLSPDRFDTILAHDMVTDAYGFDRAAYARFGPVIDVRWVDNLEDGPRTTLEHALRLYRAEHRGGSTWRYQMPDASPERLRTIVAHDLVTDTGGFDRGSLELDASAGDISQFTDYRPIYASGWHPAESDPTVPESTWRWTQRIATLSFANPNADAAFYLDYSARPDLFADTPQTVTVRAGDQVLQSFPADAAGRRLRRVPLPATVPGTGDTTVIQIAVDRTFVPATQPAGERDERELGIQVHHAFVVLR